MLRDEVGRLAGNAVHAMWEAVVRRGALGPRHRRARNFARFGNGSLIAFPASVIFGEGRIALGEGSIIGPLASLSAGMPTQANLRGDPVITIGDRCMLGKGIGIVGHERYRLLGECNRAQGADTTHTQACARLIEDDLVAALDAVGIACLDLAQGQQTTTGGEALGIEGGDDRLVGHG